MLVTDVAGHICSSVLLESVMFRSNVTDKPGFCFVVLISILIEGSEILVAIKNVLKNKTFTQAKTAVGK